MTRAPANEPVRADVREIDGTRLRVSLRGKGAGLDLFGPQQAARELGAAPGVRLLVATDLETVAGDVQSVDGGVVELILIAPLFERAAVVVLRRAHGRGPHA